MLWLRMRFKTPRQKVFVHVDEHNQPIVDERGRAHIRYRVDDDRTYLASKRHLSPLPDAEVQSSSVPITDAAQARKKKPAKPAAPAPGDPSAPLEPPEGTILAYTDGACFGNPGPAALGAVLLFGQHRKELSEYLGEGTNNIAELTAILRLLETITRRDLPVHLYTDSSYAIGVLTRGWKARANPALIAGIKELMTTFTDLNIHKVKGHSGHPLNERADELARLAIEKAQGRGEAPANVKVPTPVAPPPEKSRAHRVRVVENPRRIPTAPQEPGHILVFTDGACFGNPGPSALGAVIIDGEQREELSEYLGEGTNNIAELTAIQRALETITRRDATIHLYTDSAYAIGVLAKGWKARANPELIAQLRDLLQAFSDLTLFKVKAHIGHALNERVDELAKAAIDAR